MRSMRTGYTSYDYCVITLNEVVVGVLSGCALIVFGLVPGLFQAVASGIWNFHDSLSGSFPSPHRMEEIRQPVWLAGLGVALSAATLLAYFLR